MLLNVFYALPVFCRQYLTASLLLKSNFMRQECLDSRFVFDRPLPVSRLVTLIGSSILLACCSGELYLLISACTVQLKYLKISGHISWTLFPQKLRSPRSGTADGRMEWGCWSQDMMWVQSSTCIQWKQRYVQWWILAVSVNFRTWGRTSSRRAPQPITLTVKPCRSALARSRPARTWRDTWRRSWTVCY